MKISIITACKNAGNSLEKTITSVISQQFSPLEYVVVDGASTDETFNVLQKFRKNLSKIISEPDEGAYDAFNKGIRLSTGDVIGILNAGDWYEPGVFEKVAAIFQEHPDIGVVHGDQRTFDSGGRVVMVIKPPLSPRAWRYGMPVNHPTCFVRREVYDRIGLFDSNFRIASDYELMIRMIRSGVQLHYVPDILANFSYGGLSSNLYEKLKEERDILIRHGQNQIFAAATFAIHLMRGRLKTGMERLGLHACLQRYRGLSKRKVPE